MLISSKKGIAAEQLVVIVLVIAAFMLIAGVVTRFMSNADDKQAENLCRDSIAVRAATSISIDGTFIHGEAKLSPVLCKTIDKKVSGDREEIKQQIANSMARCWWMFGEGKYEQILDNGAMAPAFFNLDQSENDCFVCSTAPINEDSFEPITTQEFYRYLSTTKIPTVKDKTYLEYIQQHGGPGAIQLLENIEPRKAYGISFLAKNKDLEGTFWGGVGKTAAGAVIVVGAGLLSVACTATVVCPIIIGATAVSGVLVGAAGYADLKVQVKEALYGTEREVSMVVFDDLDTAQQKCFKGDLAGE